MEKHFRLAVIVFFVLAIFLPTPSSSQTNKRTSKPGPDVKANTATWSKTFGTKGFDCGYAIQQTLDGGYIVTGSTRPDPKASQYLSVIRLDSYGNKVWDRVFDGGGKPSTGGSAGYAVLQVTDGGFVLSGVKNSTDWGKNRNAWDELWVMRLDKSGITTWEKSFDGQWGKNTSSAEGHSIWQTPDGGLVLGGTNSKRGGTIQGWILRLDSQGAKVWDRFLEEVVPSGTPRCLAMVPTPDGSLVLTYMTPQIFGTIRVVKLDPDGKMIWQKNIRNPGRTKDDSDEIKCISLTFDKGFILTGSTGASNWVSRDVWLIKLDENGLWQWDRAYSRGGVDTAESGQQTKDEGYVLAGWTQGHNKVNGLLVMRLDQKGNVIWTRNLGDPKLPDKGFAVQQTKDGGFIATGVKSRSHTVAELWVIKLDENGNMGGGKKTQAAAVPFQVKAGAQSPVQE